MKEQIGIPANLPFQEINKICDLIYFEGPILSHFKDENGQDYFSYWVDEDEKGYRWLIFKVEEYDIYLFLIQQVPLRNLILKVNEVHVSTIDDDFSDTLRVKSKLLRLDYLPERNYYYKYEIPNVYAEMISNISLASQYHKNKLFPNIKAEAYPIARNIASGGKRLLQFEFA